MFIDNDEQLFTLIKQNNVVITPNNRLSEEILHRFYLQKKELIQDKPKCLPYAIFLQHEFKKFCYQNRKLITTLLCSINIFVEPRWC